MPLQSRFTVCLGIIISILLNSVVSVAQFQKPDISMPSANAASLGIYGEIPVSLYTGTTSAEIPIFTLEEGKIKVPITLSYHASGVRINQHPGWTGLNWNLNAGGMITRRIKDAADEIIESPRPYSSSSTTFVTGYYHNSTILAGSNWNSPTYLKSFDDVITKDTEPDE